jgi:hypothetical protein
MNTKLEHVATRFHALADALETHWLHDEERLAMAEDQPAFFQALRSLNTSANELSTALAHLMKELEGLQ